MILSVICVGHRAVISGYTDKHHFINPKLTGVFVFAIIVVLLLSFVLYVLCMIKYTKC